MLLATISLAAQENTKVVTGRVVDAATGQPLAGVIVSAYGNQRRTTMTDETGHYELTVPDDTRSVIMRIEGYNLEARLLVATAAGKTAQELLRDLSLYTSPEVAERVEELTARRIAGEPVAYITGSWEFYGLPMIITPDVLIPRMDTELLVDTAKELLNGRKMDARVLDLCCGSGCIACAVGRELPATRIVAVDISAKALDVARRNIAANRLSSRAICIQADATVSPPMSPMCAARTCASSTSRCATTSRPGRSTAARTA